LGGGDQGTVLAVQKGGILSVPPTDLGILPSTYKDGTVHPPNAFARGMVKGQNDNSRFLQVGEKVYPLKIDVNVKSDKVSFTVVQCDSCNGSQYSSYKAQVVFQFPKGYVASADAGQLADMINQVLPVDGGAGGGQAPAADTQPAPQQNNAPPTAPAKIEIGQTPEQVKAILGEPDQVFDGGPKQIFIYKNLKVTFVKGKVTDVQ
jgi:hypothetical protein